VHYFLGDVDPSNPLSTDEECAFALRVNRQNPMLAAASVAETKAATFAMRPTMVKRGDRSTSYGDAAQAFLMLARQLRLNASIASTTVYCGGMDVSEHAADRRDLTLTQPFVDKHLHETTRDHRRSGEDPGDPRGW